MTLKSGIWQIRQDTTRRIYIYREKLHSFLEDTLKVGQQNLTYGLKKVPEVKQ